MYPLCLVCRRRRPSYDFAWAACHYSSPLKELIHNFKFEDKTYLRFLFIDLLNDFINTYHLNIDQFDYLIPMPMSAVRLRERGFNQSLLLSQELSNRTSIPTLEDLVIKNRHTQSQLELSLKNRFTNLKGAFRMNQNLKMEPYHQKHLSAAGRTTSAKGLSFLIIDDLLTTGSSASEVASILKDAGAKTVGVLTLAITI
jgi:competence protein ComFC